MMTWVGTAPHRAFLTILVRKVTAHHPHDLRLRLEPLLLVGVVVAAVVVVAVAFDVGAAVVVDAVVVVVAVALDVGAVVATVVVVGAAVVVAAVVGNQLGGLVPSFALFIICGTREG